LIKEFFKVLETHLI